MAAAESECHKEPNFAVVCSFIERYGTLLGVPEISFDALERYLVDMGDVPVLLKDILLRLLRRWKTVNPEKWERTLKKYCHTYSEVDAWEVEQVGFCRCKVSTKLRILKNLFETQFDCNPKFKEKINQITSHDLRSKPIGRDKNGLTYWYQMDRQMNVRIYREDQDDVEAENWEIVVKRRDELEFLIGKLTTQLSAPEEKSRSATPSTIGEGETDQGVPDLKVAEQFKAELEQKVALTHQVTEEFDVTSDETKVDIKPKVEDIISFPVVKTEVDDKETLSCQNDIKVEVADTLRTLTSEVDDVTNVMCGLVSDVVASVSVDEVSRRKRKPADADHLTLDSDSRSEGSELEIDSTEPPPKRQRGKTLTKRMRKSGNTAQASSESSEDDLHRRTPPRRKRKEPEPEVDAPMSKKEAKSDADNDRGSGLEDSSTLSLTEKSQQSSERVANDVSTGVSKKLEPEQDQVNSLCDASEKDCSNEAEKNTKNSTVERDCSASKEPSPPSPSDGDADTPENSTETPEPPESITGNAQSNGVSEPANQVEGRKTPSDNFNESDEKLPFSTLASTDETASSASNDALHSHDVTETANNVTETCAGSNAIEAVLKQEEACADGTARDVSPVRLGKKRGRKRAAALEDKEAPPTPVRRSARSTKGVKPQTFSELVNQEHHMRKHRRHVIKDDTEDDDDEEEEEDDDDDEDADETEKYVVKKRRRRTKAEIEEEKRLKEEKRKRKWKRMKENGELSDHDWDPATKGGKRGRRRRVSSDEDGADDLESEEDIFGLEEDEEDRHDWRKSPSASEEEAEDSDASEYKPVGRNAKRQEALKQKKQDGDVEKTEQANDFPCSRCGNCDHPEWILLCDRCDAGFHMSCLRPPLMIIPVGDWFCPPCEHKMLLENLQAKLLELDKNIKEIDRMKKRQERLDFINISLGNIITTNDGLSPSKRSRKKVEYDDFTSGGESGSGGESDAPGADVTQRRPANPRRPFSSSSSSTEYSDESSPEVAGRKRRPRYTRDKKTVSYKFEEFDDVINEAIGEDIREKKEYGPIRRSGKDIANIEGMPADDEEEKVKRKVKGKRLTQLDSDEEDDDEEDEYNATEDEPSNDEEFVPQEEDLSDELDERRRSARSKKGHNSYYDDDDFVVGSSYDSDDTEARRSKRLSGGISRHKSSKHKRNKDKKKKKKRHKRLQFSDESDDLSDVDYDEEEEMYSRVGRRAASRKVTYHEDTDSGDDVIKKPRKQKAAATSGIQLQNFVKDEETDEYEPAEEEDDSPEEASVPYAAPKVGQPPLPASISVPPAKNPAGSHAIENILSRNNDRVESELDAGGDVTPSDEFEESEGIDLVDYVTAEH